MFQYYVKLASLSIRKSPILSALMVLAIALGIGASMTTITVNYLMSSDPIPHKSDRLFHVRLDNWSPHNANQDNGDPPPQVTFIEAINLTAAKKAKRQSAMGGSGGIVEPSDKDSKPYQASIRLAYTDFFPMFDVPFLYGAPWPASSDDNKDLVVVLSRESNDKLFGGQDSVGKTLRVVGQEFRVVGVLDNWEVVPRFFDINTGALNDMEDLYMPFSLKEELELPAWGNTNCWKSPDEPGFKGLLKSECVFNQFWIELDSPSDKDEYLAFLDAYVEQQKALGRFPRPMNNKVNDVMEWMQIRQVVPDDARIMMWLSFMFLAVCLLNTIGLLLAKFSGKTGEIGLRRAVGASKGDLFAQHLVETGLIGICGGILGLGLAVVGLKGIAAIYGDEIAKVVTMDINLVVMALLLSLVSSIAAGLYPTWRSCNIAPASTLKTQ